MVPKVTISNLKKRLAFCINFSPVYQIRCTDWSPTNIKINAVCARGTKLRRELVRDLDDRVINDRHVKVPSAS